MSNRHNPLMEPVFFTPPRRAGHAFRLHKGGGGNTYYENQDKLLGVQGDIATGMYDQYTRFSEAPLQALASMAGENPGDITARLRLQARERAGVNASQSLDAALGGTQRSMGRYGSAFNPERMQAQMTDEALGSAALRASSLNEADANATQFGEQLGWARNQDLYSALAGMPGNATSALGSAASGYGGMARDQTQLQSAGAQGMGQFGSALAYGLLRADGGDVSHAALDEQWIAELAHRRRHAPQRFANGGAPSLKDWRSRPSNAKGPEAPSPVMSLAAGAAPSVVGHYAAPYIDSAITGIKGAMGLGSGASAAGIGTAAQAASGALPAGVTALSFPVGATGAATGAAAAGAGTAAAGAGATAAGTGAAATGAAAGGAAALGAAVPWIGGAYLLGSALDLWADGGTVPHEGDPRYAGRRDMRTGGKVAGPGTETSDSIPALLSDGEYVLNAEAVKQVGKERLEKMNRKGLKARDAKAAPKGKAAKGKRKLADGGSVAYGNRTDGSPKGQGFLGELMGPDGSVSTELAFGVDFGQGEVEIPLLVPTLTPDEARYLVDGNEPTEELYQKAIQHAQQRISQGMSPFAQAGEGAQR